MKKTKPQLPQLPQLHQTLLGKIIVNTMITINNNNKKKHDIYWSGSQWYCNNCNEHGDRPYMTKETSCNGDKNKQP